MKAMDRSCLRLFMILLLITSTPAFQVRALAVPEGSLPVETTQTSHEAVAFTHDDRERLIRLEVKVSEGQASLQHQIDDLKDSVKLAINDVRNLIYVVLAGMFTLVGFILWDRRTLLHP